MTLKDVDALVEMSVKYYKSDWYDIDRPRAERDDSFIISLRSSGVDCLFMGCEASYSNMMWNKSCYDSGRAEAIYFYNHGEMGLISQSEAREQLNKLMESFPEGYIFYCEGRDVWREYSPTVDEYRRYMEYEQDARKRCLSVVSLRDWVAAEKFAEDGESNG